MNLKTMSLSVMAFALLLTGCNKEGENLATTPGEPAKVSIYVSSEGSRAVDNTGNTLPGDVVNNFSVFITDNTGEIKWTGYSNDGTALSGAGAIDVSTDAQHVYIIANGGDLTSTISTKALLDSYTLDMTNAAQNQQTVRWATGSTASPLTFVQVGDNDFEATTNVALSFVAARISLKIKNSMTGYDGTEDGSGPLVLREVAVTNAVKESKLFGTSLVPAVKTYLTGIDPIAKGWKPPYPAAGDYTVSPLMLDPIAADDFTSQYYYYVFENDGLTIDDFPTIITLRGEIKGKEIDYPVHLAPYEQLTAGTAANGVKRGQHYEIVIDLKVDPTDGGGGGGDGPGTPIVTATVDVSITPATWNVVTMQKEIN